MRRHEGAVLLAVVLGLGASFYGCDRTPAAPASPSSGDVTSGGAAESAGLVTLVGAAESAGNLSNTVSAVAPPDSIVVDMSQAVNVRVPFVLRESSSAPAGVELALIEKTPKSAPRASAMLKVNLETGGKYRAWLHTRWKDGCGNSVGIQVDALPDRTAGQDAVYGEWHWVSAGEEYDLAAGMHAIFLLGRENNIVVDQFLLTRDAAFVPLGVIGHPEKRPELRRFADDFSRSPGHGLEAWEQISGTWDIAFSLDPNRIPNQYTFRGTAAEGEAVALVKGLVWNGCRMRMALFPTTEGRFGMLLDRRADGSEALSVGVRLAGGRATLQVNGEGVHVEKELGGAVRLNQWHGLVVERWGWTLRVLLDDQELLLDDSLPVRSGAVGLFIDAGSAIFDNVDIVQIPWQADDGKTLTIPWRFGKDAKWYRAADPADKGTLVGTSGTISTEWHGMPVTEIVRQDDKAKAVERQLFNDPSMTVASFTADGETRIRRVAIRYGYIDGDFYRIGPYSFDQEEIEDPSDYLEFTREELAEIAKDPVKLQRKMKYIPVLENSDNEYAPWRVSQGTWAWTVRNGVLAGTGPGVIVRHAQEMIGDVEMRLKCRLTRSGTAVEIELYGGPASGRRIQLVSGSTTGVAGADLRLTVTPETQPEWHDVRIKAEGRRLSVQLDDTPWQSATITQGNGGQVRLKVLAGSAEFDDIEFIRPRRTAQGKLYAMDSPETDWWREGGVWLDHGGVTCVFASSWLSLIASQGEGMIWNKHSFGNDLEVAFDVEENTEWRGWTGVDTTSHVHYPYENICLRLSPDGQPESGYRVEINSRHYTTTALYRNGVEVKAVSQRGGFPIQFLGREFHKVQHPRCSRITLVRRGGDLKLIINGREVLRYNDPEPLRCPTIGIGGYKTRANFSNIEIVNLAGGVTGGK